MGEWRNSSNCSFIDAIEHTPFGIKSFSLWQQGCNLPPVSPLLPAYGVRCAVNTLIKFSCGFLRCARRVGILKWGSGFIFRALEAAAQLHRIRMSVSEGQNFAHAHFAIEVACVVTFLQNTAIILNGPQKKRSKFRFQ